MRAERIDGFYTDYVLVTRAVYPIIADPCLSQMHIFPFSLSRSNFQELLWNYIALSHPTRVQLQVLAALSKFFRQVVDHYLDHQRQPQRRQRLRVRRRSRGWLLEG